MITPEEVAQLFRSIGLTKDDIYDPNRTHMKDGEVRPGDMTDKVRCVIMPQDKNACLIPAIGRSDLAMDWMLVLKDDPTVCGETVMNYEFWWEVINLMDTVEPLPDIETIEGIGEMTPDQFMDYYKTPTGYPLYSTRNEILTYRWFAYEADSEFEGTFEEWIRATNHGRNDQWLGKLSEEEAEGNFPRQHSPKREPS